MIELRGGLSLAPPQLRLIERLFTGCSRVVVTKMQGGFSGSLVLRTDSYTQDGEQEEPTVTKLDNGAMMVSEVQQTKVVAELVGVEAISVMRGPQFVDMRGHEKQESVKVLFEKIDRAIDGPLIENVRSGAVRLVKCGWLADAALSDPAFDVDEVSSAPIVKRRQDLPEAAFHTTEEAAVMLERGNRSVLVLSHCWQTVNHPDPQGITLAATRRYLRSDPTLKTCALFWDFLSLHQKNSDTWMREPEEDAEFKTALKVMGSLYASLTGTTVVQVKHVPKRPRHYDGLVQLFNVPKGTSEENLAIELSEFHDGTLRSIEIMEQAGQATLLFSSHKEALRMCNEMKAHGKQVEDVSPVNLPSIPPCNDVAPLPLM